MANVVNFPSGGGGGGLNILPMILSQQLGLQSSRQLMRERAGLASTRLAEARSFEAEGTHHQGALTDARNQLSLLDPDSDEYKQTYDKWYSDANRQSSEAYLKSRYGDDPTIRAEKMRFAATRPVTQAEARRAQEERLRLEIPAAERKKRAKARATFARDKERVAIKKFADLQTYTNTLAQFAEANPNATVGDFNKKRLQLGMRLGLTIEADKATNVLVALKNARAKNSEMISRMVRTNTNVIDASVKAVATATDKLGPLPRKSNQHTAWLGRLISAARRNVSAQVSRNSWTSQIPGAKPSELIIPAVAKNIHIPYKKDGTPLWQDAVYIKDFTLTTKEKEATRKLMEGMYTERPDMGITRTLYDALAGITPTKPRVGKTEVALTEIATQAKPATVKSADGAAAPRDPNDPYGTKQLHTQLRDTKGMVRRRFGRQSLDAADDGSSASGPLSWERFTEQLRTLLGVAEGTEFLGKAGSDDAAAGNKALVDKAKFEELTKVFAKTPAPTPETAKANARLQALSDQGIQTPQDLKKFFDDLRAEKDEIGDVSLLAGRFFREALEVIKVANTAYGRTTPAY